MQTRTSLAVLGQVHTVVCALVLAAVEVASTRHPQAPFVAGRFAETPGMVNSGTPPNVPPSADCSLRELAYAYGKTLKPDRGGFADLYDALQLHACNVTAPSVRDSWSPPSSLAPRVHGPRQANHVIYVDPSSAPPRTERDDGAAKVGTGVPGSITRPLSTLQAAVTLSRDLVGPVDILLRAGTHHVATTIELGPIDSGLRIAAFPGEEAIVSGGIPLDTKWTPSAACVGCFETALPSIASIPGLRHDGVREIRARWCVPSNHIRFDTNLASPPLRRWMFH